MSTNLDNIIVRSWIERLVRLSVFTLSRRRPPCEVVNWKGNYNEQTGSSYWSTSLWGRELKDLTVPLYRLSAVSTSLWGRELKGLSCSSCSSVICRPPCEVVNWKIYRPADQANVCVDLLVRSWIERLSSCVWLFASKSTSLWGRELNRESRQ